MPFAFQGTVVLVEVVVGGGWIQMPFVHGAWQHNGPEPIVHVPPSGMQGGPVVVVLAGGATGAQSIPPPIACSVRVPNWSVTGTDGSATRGHLVL